MRVTIIVMAVLGCVLEIRAQDTLTLKVFKVRDGDTIEAKSKEGEEFVIRFHGIDSPDKCQPYYEAATQFVVDKLLNQTIMYVETGMDRYDRSVGEILVEPDDIPGQYSIWFNQVIVSAGLAWHWPRYSNSEKLKQAQIDAQKMKVGLWQDQKPSAPWEWRTTSQYKNCVIRKP